MAVTSQRLLSRKLCMPGRRARGTFGGDGEQAGTDGARAVSHDGDVGAVAAEVGDVVLQPGERRALVVQGEIGER